MRRERTKTAKKGTVMNILGGSFLTREDFSKIFPFLVYLPLALLMTTMQLYTGCSAGKNPTKVTL